MSDLPLPWFRERDADELERERQHVEKMRWVERAAMEAGYNVRPKPRASN